jgi:hypothetical protein
MNHAYYLKSRSFSNCEDIHSAFVCKSSNDLCGWDRNLNECVYVHDHPHYHSIRFKENEENSRRKYRHHEHHHRKHKNKYNY